MTFLAPIAGIVGGSVALAMLVSMHILRLRRAPVRVSAVWIWEAASKDTQANVPFQRLRPSWLMLWQLLALALLSMALARPSIVSPYDASERVVLIIDTSTSMGVRQQGNASTRLERARQQARDRLDDMSFQQYAGEIAILEASSDLRVRQPFTSSMRAARRALARIVQTDQEGELDDSISRAVSLLQAAPGGVDKARGRIVCFSDRVTRRVEQIDLELPDGIQLEIVDPSPGIGPQQNVGIVAIHAERDRSRPDRVSLFVQILSTSRGTLRVPVVIDVNAEPAIAREIEIPPASEDGPALHALNESLTIAGGAIVSVRLRYEDALPADNIAHSVLGARHAPRVMIVSSDGQSDPFLAHALRSIGVLAVRTVSQEEYESVWANSIDVDAIVFDRADTSVSPSVPTLSFGSTGGIPGISLTSSSSPETTGLTFWKRGHPVMTSVSLEQVLVVDPPTLSGLDQIDPSLALEVLARTPSGPAIVEIEDGASSHVVVTTPLANSNWPLDASFIVFLSNVMSVLTPDLSPASRSYSSSETILLPPEAGSEQIRLEGPESWTWDVPAASKLVAIGPIPRAGAYEVRGSSTHQWLAINTASQTESSLVQADFEYAASSEESNTQHDPIETRREIWHWFLAGGLILLMIEWFISTLGLRA